MSRLIATGDIHLGLKRFGRETPAGNSRVLDFAATLERFVDAAIEHECDFAALLGDNFHTRHPGPRELALFTEQIQRMTREGIVPLILPGNHDGMDTIGDPASHTLAWMRAARMPEVRVLIEPGVRWVENQNTRAKIVVASVPYPHRRALDTTSDATPDERVEDVSVRVERLITELGREARQQAGMAYRAVFLGHLSVTAAKLGSEQSMRIGWDVTVSSHVFEDFDLALLGHIHRAQRIGEKVMYVGSPDYHLFEDARQQKAFVLADLQPGGVELVRIDSKARRMLDFDCVYEDGEFSINRVAPMPGAMVRITVHAHDARPTQQRLAELREMFVQADASFVKIDVDMPVRESRTGATIRSEDAPEAALEAWLAAQEDIPVEPTLTVGKQLIASAMNDAAQ